MFKKSLLFIVLSAILSSYSCAKQNHDQDTMVGRNPATWGPNHESDKSDSGLIKCMYDCKKAHETAMLKGKTDIQKDIFCCEVCANTGKFLYSECDIYKKRQKKFN